MEYTTTIIHKHWLFFAPCYNVSVNNKQTNKRLTRQQTEINSENYQSLCNADWIEDS